MGCILQVVLVGHLVEDSRFQVALRRSPVALLRRRQPLRGRLVAFG
jgi:hypothetical protein